MVRPCCPDLILFRAPEPVCVACGRLLFDTAILLLYMVTSTVIFSGAIERFSRA